MFIQISSHKQSTNTRRIKTSIMNRRFKTQKEITYYNNGQIQTEMWYRNGEYHRSGGAPAVIHYFEKDIDFYRHDGATDAIRYYEDKQIESVEWINDGKVHRTGGTPAYIKYYRNGQIQYKAWCEHGKTHRIYAPAVITYFENGTTNEKRWVEYGKNYRIDK